MIYGEVDIRLSIVKRWSIVKTIQTQSVAEHAFNTTRIAERIAFEWFHITDAWKLLEITRYAIHHDDEEAIMGDTPSIVTDLIDREAARNRYSDILVDLSNMSGLTKRVVKLADMMEAALFLHMEMSLGNKSVRSVLGYIEERIFTYMREVGVNWDNYVGLVLKLFPDGQYTIHHFERRRNATKRSTNKSVAKG